MIIILESNKRNNVNLEKQKVAFVAQLKIANETKMPIVIHCRNTEEMVFELLKLHLDKTHKIHLHCFTGDWKTANKYLNEFENLFIGVTPLITFDTNTEVRKLIENMPLGRLLLETDAPYFTPKTVSFKFVFNFGI